MLIVEGSLEGTATAFSLSTEQAEQVLEGSREVLYTERQKRPKPHRDNKILTAWNGAYGRVKCKVILVYSLYVIPVPCHTRVMAYDTVTNDTVVICHIHMSLVTHHFAATFVTYCTLSHILLNTVVLVSCHCDASWTLRSLVI